VGAAQGIDALATSLEKLKKNGAFKTVVNNLNNLSSALKNLPNVHQSSNALRTLANSIEKLAGVKSISSVSNSLKKIPDALKSLEKIDFESTGMRIAKIVSALSPLGDMKAGGFGSMVNGLAKIKKVTDGLDEATISEFAKKVSRLNDELGPFASKMATVKAGFNAINSSARQAASGVKDFSEDIDTSMLNMSSFVEVANAAIGALQGIIQRVGDVISQSIEWDGVAARFGRSFGESAEETYAWIQRLNEEMGINVQQFMQYSSLYAQMLTGFGVASKDATKMALGYTELTYDIWASANDRYKTFEDAAEAVASAIAGEVEPIRRAGFTIVEATLAETAAYHGLDISLANATEAQKSYLRYLTLVDQAHSTGTVGVYASELNTAEGMMRTFSQQLKSLAQAFGSLFLPVLVKVMPYLQAFVELLADGVRYIAGLFGIKIQDIGDTWKGFGEGAGAIDKVADSAGGATDALDSATAAAKELKNATLGIDELNVISPSTASGAGGGAGGAGGTGGGAGGGFDGLDIDSLWDESIFDNIQSKVDDIKSKLKGMFDDWLPTLKIIGGALTAWSIAGLLDQLGNAIGLGDKFSGVVTNIKKLASTAIIVAIPFKLMEDAFSDFLSGEGTIMDYIEGVVIGAASSYLLYKMWGPAGLTIGLGITSAVSLKTVIDAGGVTDMESATVAITGLATGIGALAIAWKSFSDVWKAFKGTALVTWITEFVAAAKAMAPEVGWISALFPKLSTALTGIGSAIAGISAPVWAAIAAAVVAVGSAIYFLIENWEAFKEAVKDLWAENIAPKFEEMAKHFDKIKEAIKPILDYLSPITEKIKEVIDWFKELGVGTAIVEALGKAFEFLGGRIVGDLVIAVTTVVATISSLIENIVQIFSGFIQYFTGLIELIIGIFTGDGEKIKEAAQKMWDGIVDIFMGAVGLIVDPIKDIYNIVVDWFTKLWDILVGHSIVPDTINAIVDWFTGLPEKIFSAIDDFVSGIVEKFKGLWSSLVSWWDKKEALKEYTPSIGKISDKLSEAWTAAKDWWNKSKSALSYTPSIGKIWEKLRDAWTGAKDWWNKNRSSLSYTPSIGKIWEKLKSAWTSAKDWWNKSRSSLSYTPSIGKISSKLSSAWTAAKNWWNKSRSSLSYTPSIGSIKDKVISAWNSAKKWWSSNASLSTKLNISVPKLTVNWGEVSALGKTFKYPKSFSVKFAAKGGIFDQGSMIWAGERGPEIVANAAGGKTGVMNVQQMQDAVFEGVYSAVVAAMRGRNSEGSGEIRVYLDGREINASVKKHERESGANIMGNEVYSF
jgi:hypothetical protein